MTTRLAAAGVAAVVAALALASAGGTHVVREGGTFRVAALIGRVDTIDPGLVDFFPESHLLDPACARLVAYPDKPLPAGFRLEPDLAEAEPVISKDGRKYTFTIRNGARFSSGAPVTARAFAHALERILTPAMRSNVAGTFEDILGARKMLAGKTSTLAGVVAKGRTLTLRLKERVPDMLDRLTILCAVPPNLPADAEGADAPLPSAAPYYVSEYIPGKRLVMKRNRFYRGERPRHVATFVADLAVDPGVALDQVANGTFDTLAGQFGGDQTAELVRRYGVNRSRFFAVPGGGLRVFFLDTSRPLFRKNPKLRQAINFAVDRRALAREAGTVAETPTDQFLLPGVPGYRNERIYPLKRPEVRRALLLAKGRTRGGKAVLFTIDNSVDVAMAQILQRNLKAIGIEVEIKQFPVPLFFDKLETEPYDLVRLRYGPITPDPAALLNIFRGPDNFSRFNSPKYNRLLDRASALTGEARYRAFGELDVRLSRDAAPAIPVSVINGLAFVSARAGCVVVNPWLDLTAVCLK